MAFFARICCVVFRFDIRMLCEKHLEVSLDTPDGVECRLGLGVGQVHLPLPEPGQPVEPPCRRRCKVEASSDELGGLIATRTVLLEVLELGGQGEEEAWAQVRPALLRGAGGDVEEGNGGTVQGGVLLTMARVCAPCWW